ncbi:MAG: hypothetical protein QOG93_2481 [Gaiellaceae bacterium]|nr:hypothetical protein [Gaiellaceae bacterium]
MGDHQDVGKGGAGEGESGIAPSVTNPQCKVCSSPDRRAIEVALVQGQSQERIARAFTRGDQAFSRQNIHSHYRRHMQVVAKETVEEARLLSRNAMLDVETARQIDRGHQELRSLLWESARTAAASGRLRWTAKDMILFLQCDVEIEQTRYRGQVVELMRDAAAFIDAAKALIPMSKWGELFDSFAALQKREGFEDAGLFHPGMSADDDRDDEDSE